MTPDGDQMFHILYDGTVMDERDSRVLGGDADAISERLGEAFADGLDLRRPRCAPARRARRPRPRAPGRRARGRPARARQRPALLPPPQRRRGRGPPHRLIGRTKCSTGRAGVRSAAVTSIDLNSDLGESFGVWKLGDDEAMLRVRHQRQRRLRVPRRRPLDAADGVQRGGRTTACRSAPRSPIPTCSASAGGTSTSTRASSATRCSTSSARSTPSPRSPAPRSTTSSRTARCTTRRSPTRPRPTPWSPPPPSTTRRSPCSARPARRCCERPTRPGSSRCPRRSPTGRTCPTAGSCRGPSPTRCSPTRPRWPPGGPPRDRARGRVASTGRSCASRRARSASTATRPARSTSPARCATRSTLPASACTVHGVTLRLLPSGPRAWLVELASRGCRRLRRRRAQTRRPGRRRRRAGGAHSARRGRRPRVARSSRGVAAHGRARGRAGRRRDGRGRDRGRLRRRRPRRRRRGVRHVASTRSSRATPRRRTGARSAGSPPASPTSPDSTRRCTCPAGPRRGRGCRPARWRSPPSTPPCTRACRRAAGTCSGAPTRRMWDADRDEPALVRPGHARQVRGHMTRAHRRRRRVGDDDPGRRPAGARRPRRLHRAGRSTAALRAVLNRLVGNPEDAAVLETLGGLRRAAVIGSRRGRRAPSWRRSPSPAGEIVDVEPARDTLWGYLAVRGGIAVEPVLGSRSQDSRSGLGPPPIAPGTSLPSAPTRAPRSSPTRHRHDHDRDVVDVWPGPRVDWFVDGALDQLAADGVDGVARRQPRRRTARRDRRSPRARTDELPSEGLVTGAVQVPPDGQPVVMLADHPTTGGYPVIAVVDDASLAAVVAGPPGRHAAVPRPTLTAGARHTES